MTYNTTREQTRRCKLTRAQREAAAAKARDFASRWGTPTEVEITPWVAPTRKTPVRGPGGRFVKRAA